MEHPPKYTVTPIKQRYIYARTAYRALCCLNRVIGFFRFCRKAEAKRVETTLAFLVPVAAKD
jgi:hypothetical protein